MWLLVYWGFVLVFVHVCHVHVYQTCLKIKFLSLCSKDFLNGFGLGPFHFMFNVSSFVATPHKQFFLIVFVEFVFNGILVSSFIMNVSINFICDK